MKKIVLSVVAVVFAVSLSACSSPVASPLQKVTETLNNGATVECLVVQNNSGGAIAMQCFEESYVPAAK